VAKELSAEERRNWMVRKANLTALVQHPSWPDLVSAVGERQAAIEKIVLARTLYGRTPMQPMEVGFYKGFIAGMRFFLAVGSTAEGALERYLTEHGARTEEEADAA